MVQLSIDFLRNSNLFSTHYLESLIQQNPEWEDDYAVKESFDTIGKIYKHRKDQLPRLPEAQLEEYFIKPVLKALGHHYGVQAKVDASAKRPDYAFFPDESALNEALDNQGKDDFYMKAVAVGDAKSWKTSLDKKRKGGRAVFEDSNPSYQIDTYLRETPPNWAILTNGRYWRLYYKETSYKLDRFYEVDLVHLLEVGNLEEFKYFYLFFRLGALTKGIDSKCFLDRVYEESVIYAKELGESLRENIYQAMKVLAEGFIAWPENNLTKHPDDITLIHENTLKFLYRLIFIFYAESRNLLDLKSSKYAEMSLFAMREKIAERIDKRDMPLPVKTEYWTGLSDLFRLIDIGSEAYGISEDVLYIPPYNGGLFDPARNQFLQEKVVGDYYVAQAIDLLGRAENGSGRGFVDYSSLEIRHLGSIYEGLLEYRLMVAEGDMVAVRDKGKDKWVPKEKWGGKVREEVKAGALYLATDKGERKATGSYYTPDYIVKYIIKNVLDPLIERKKEEWIDRMDQPFWQVLLELRILDPAMGSGHFLVEATDYLAHELVRAWAEARPEELEREEVAEQDVQWAKREVVRRCIYGVDLNPMAVELAKLSMWLSTVAANKPLTFLDHHLKVGNSLIGAKVDDLKILPTLEKKRKIKNVNAKQNNSQSALWNSTIKQHFDDLIKRYSEIAEQTDDDLATVKKKQKEYDVLKESELNLRFHELANVWLSVYFENDVPPGEYATMQNGTHPDHFPSWDAWRGKEWFGRAQEIAQEKRFYHWELEFPEVFYEKGSPKGNPGWDAVVGNPPYVKARMGDKMREERRSMANMSQFKSLNYMWDTYIAFMEIGLQKTKKGGYFSYIIPDAFNQATYSKSLKKEYFDKNSVVEISHFPNWKIFYGVGIFNIIIILKKEIPSFAFLSSRKVFTSPYSMDTYDLQKVPNNDERLYVLECGIELQADELQTISLGEICFTSYGLRLNSDKKDPDKFTKNDLLSDFSSDVHKRKYTEGKYLERYGIQATIFLEWDTERCPKRLVRPTFPELYQPPKLLLGRQTWHVAYDSEKLICDNTCMVCIPYREFKEIDNSHLRRYFNSLGVNRSICENKSMNYNIKFLCSLLNSRYLQYLLSRVRPGNIDAYPDDWKNLPIRRISFTTPPDSRTALTDEAKTLYSEFLSTSDNQKILGFVGVRLEAQPEESDVVHDLLAHLAERMIEMNKEKNAEIKIFLSFIEGEIGASVSDLANKTTIKRFYNYEFQKLIDILSKNKKKFKGGYDPKTPTNYKHLLEWYTDSVNKLEPLMSEIKVTDDLIDQIVYRLYSLNEDEIKIVEESVSNAG